MGFESRIRGHLVCLSLKVYSVFISEHQNLTTIKSSNLLTSMITAYFELLKTFKKNAVEFKLKH